MKAGRPIRILFQQASGEMIMTVWTRAVAVKVAGDGKWFIPDILKEGLMEFA